MTWEELQRINKEGYIRAARVKYKGKIIIAFEIDTLEKLTKLSKKLGLTEPQYMGRTETIRGWFETFDLYKMDCYLFVTKKKIENTSKKDLHFLFDSPVRKEKKYYEEV